MIPGSSVLVSSTATEVITTWTLVDSSNNPLHGVSVLASIFRASDGKPYDFSTNTFTASPVTPTAALSEIVVSSTGLGIYTYSWNLGAITNPVANDVYTVVIGHGSTTAVNANSMIGEIRTWGALTAAVAVATAPAVLGTAVPGGFGAGTVGKVLANLDSTISGIPNAVVAQTVTGAPSGSIGWNVLLSRQLLRNRKIITASNLVVYADDGVTPMLTIPLHDINGGNVQPPPGEPAQYGP